MKTILFVCVENTGRSKMAEAFAKVYGKDKFVVSSAGNKPADKVNPVMVEVMKEKGIDISMNKPKLITAKMAMDQALIVTMAATTMEFVQVHSSSLPWIGRLKTLKANQ